MNTDDDWRAHCDENWEHCKPQAGDTCGYVGPSGDECGYVHTGDPDEDHHHCDTCGMPVNSGDEMGAHCDENPDHCGGGDHDGGPPFEDVDSNGDGSIDREEARSFFGDDPNFDEEYDKIDTNGDGMVDHAEYMAADGGDHDGGDGDHDGGDGDHDGGPPFEDVDTNGDGVVDREEARAMFGHDDEGNPDPEFDAEYDKIAGDDGVVDHAEYMAAGDGGPPTNHWDGNCGAMKHGESEYWLDSDGDPSNGAEDGPYAVWYEDADGNSVDCQPPPNDGNQN